MRLCRFRRSVVMLALFVFLSNSVGCPVGPLSVESIVSLECSFLRSFGYFESYKIVVTSRLVWMDFPVSQFLCCCFSAQCDVYVSVAAGVVKCRYSLRRIRYG